MQYLLRLKCTKFKIFYIWINPLALAPAKIMKRLRLHNNRICCWKCTLIEIVWAYQAIIVCLLILYATIRSKKYNACDSKKKKIEKFKIGISFWPLLSSLWSFSKISPLWYAQRCHWHRCWVWTQFALLNLLCQLPPLWHAQQCH
jgi:hypothetical protein